jgi:endonuclease III
MVRTSPPLDGDQMKELRRQARAIYRGLSKRYPDAHCELDFTTPLELLVATVLSEADVAALFPEKDYTMLSHYVVWHGRRICHARKPACGACPVASLCPSFGEGPTDPEQAEILVRTQGRA